MNILRSNVGCQSVVDLNTGRKWGKFNSWKKAKNKDLISSVYIS